MDPHMRLTTMSTSRVVAKQLIEAMYDLCREVDAHHHMSRKTAMELLTVAETLSAIGFEDAMFTAPRSSRMDDLHAYALAFCHTHNIKLENLNDIEQKEYSHTDEKTHESIRKAIGVYKAMGNVRFKWYALWCLKDEETGENIFTPEVVADAFLIHLFDRGMWNRVPDSVSPTLVRVALKAAEYYTKLEMKVDPSLPAEMVVVATLMYDKFKNMSEEQLFDYVHSRFDSNPEEAEELVKAGLNIGLVTLMVCLFMEKAFHTVIDANGSHGQKLINRMKEDSKHWLGALAVEAPVAIAGAAVEVPAAIVEGTVNVLEGA